MKNDNVKLCYIKNKALKNQNLIINMKVLIMLINK